MFVSLVFAACLPASSANAQALPPVNLGFTTFLDGGFPAGPGIYFSQYLQSFDSHGTPDVEAFVSLTQVLFYWDKELPFGSKPGMNIILPAASAELSGIPGPPRDNGAGLGDLLLGPELQFDPILDECGNPLFVHRFEAQFIIPTGEYSNTKEVNPGAGFFSFNPYWAGTLWLSPKLTTSIRAHYLWNAENDDPSVNLPGTPTTVHSGQAFHMNFTAAYEVIPKKLRVGMNGYYLKQTTDVEFNGVDVVGMREQVLGIGPGLLYSFTEDQKQLLFLNAYFESNARNRPEGVRLNLRYVCKF